MGSGKVEVEGVQGSFGGLQLEGGGLGLWDGRRGGDCVRRWVRREWKSIMLLFMHSMDGM